MKVREGHSKKITKQVTGQHPQKSHIYGVKVRTPLAENKEKDVAPLSYPCAIRGESCYEIRVSPPRYIVIHKNGNDYEDNMNCRRNMLIKSSSDYGLNFLPLYKT